MKKINISKEIWSTVVKRFIKKEEFNVVDSMNQTPYSMNQVDGKIILRMENDQVLHWLGGAIGSCVPIMNIFNERMYCIITDSYIKDVPYEYFREFIEYHEQGHIVLGHLEDMESMAKIQLFLLKIQNLLGIGGGIKQEYLADEYAANLIGYDEVIKCLSLMNKTFKITSIQFLQFRARIKYLKKRMVE